MLDLLLTGLLQTVAGEPEVSSATEQPSASSAAAEETPTPPEEIVRCRTEPMFGSRARTVTRCTTLAQDEETRRQNRREMRRADRGTQPGGQSLGPPTP